MGFSGAFVTGVWIGNDDFRPMGNVTGGSIPAATWHSFMSVAHQSMLIPQIPGLALHPTQVTAQAAERQRLDDLRRSQPPAAIAAQEAAALSGQKRPNSLMSTQTRDALKKVASAMRTAAGIAEEPEPAPAPAAPPAAAPAASPKGPAAPGTPAPAEPLRQRRTETPEATPRNTALSEPARADVRPAAPRGRP